MKTLRLAILTLIIGLSLSTPRLHGQEYDWTGAGDNGNWSNPDNGDPFPDFSASNATQNQYQFIFEGPNQPHQNIGSQTIKVTEADGNLTLQGGISGSGGTFTKGGSGKLVIEGDHAATWSQAVVISEGALHVTNETGLATGSGGLTIGANALLSGAGGRVGSTTIEGTLSVESPQAITFADDLSLQSGSTIVMSHGAGAVLLEGDLNLGESVTLSLNGSGWTVGETYRLFDLSNGSIAGELSFSGPYLATFSYQGGEDGYVDFQLQAIPEPSGLLPGAIAFTLAAATLRSRRNRASIQC